MASMSLGQMRATLSQTFSTAVWQSGLKWTLGYFSLMSSQTRPVANSSMSFDVATSQTYFSTSPGVGMSRLPLGQKAETSSQTFSTAVWQSGLRCTLGNFSLMSSQTLSVAMSSMSFCVATSQTYFSTSWGVGMDNPLGQREATSSQTSSTAVWQSGLKWTLGNLALMSEQTLSVAISSMSFCVATSQTYFSTSWGLGMDKRSLGQYLVTRSQAISSTVLQSGSNSTPGNSALMRAQILSVALSSIIFCVATSHTYFLISSGLGSAWKGCGDPAAHRQPQKPMTMLKDRINPLLGPASATCGVKTQTSKP
mmetsp:Transcript_37073/g.106771  ORF Transcript_37073/g.106771 Transcript_37073/m.106771 type:complete len:310 (-) Transcript_37073:12-941(-)